MADDALSALPADDLPLNPKRSSRVRASGSFSYHAGSAHDMTSTHGPLTTSTSAEYTSSSSPFPPSPVTILAPTPRRHLIDNSHAQQWLGGEMRSVSPSSSRGMSPFNPYFPQHLASDRPPSTASTQGGGGSSLRRKNKAGQSPSRSRTFSSLYIQDSGGRGKPGLRHRVASNASIASTYTNHGYTSSSGITSLHKKVLKKKSLADIEAESASMGRRWIRWMHKRGLRDWVVPSIIAFTVLLKVCIGVGSYSGESTPPLYGDYEAQRHWMELTQHLPFRQWYTYDLQYWGLDYPPLTAYHSWFCGIVGSLIDPSWFALDTSRGVETPSSKLFMRTTVLVSDLLVYIPALLLFTHTFLPSPTRSSRSRSFALLTLLLQPALLLIDNGHFQFNSVMLGFTVLALCAFARGKDELGAVAFVAALGFKQMALYYAPAVGSYLVAKCLWLPAPANARLFTRLALVTTASFLVLFLPFFLPPLASSPLDVLNPITRIFPFSRGLFEDKVANWWCASNVLIKWRRIAGEGEAGRRWLVRASTALTALGFLPAVVGLVRAGWGLRLRTSTPLLKKEEEDTDSPNTKPNDNPPPFISLLTYALLTSSASFFLFSFQVHEKTILLPLLPLTLLMSAAAPGSAAWKWGCLANNVAVVSMWPLLRRDGLAVPYAVVMVLWDVVVGYNPFKMGEGVGVGVVEGVGVAVHTAAIALHILELLISAPARYPDLFPVLNVLICTPVFGLVWLWSIKCGVEVGWALGGYSSNSSSSPTSTSNIHGNIHSNTNTTIAEGGASHRPEHTGFEPIEEGAIATGSGSGAQWAEGAKRRRNVGQDPAGVGVGSLGVGDDPVY